MAKFYNTVIDLALLVAIGGILPAAGDEVFIERYALDYNSNNLAAVDLALFELAPDFSGTFKADGGAQLILQLNRTNTGIFRNNSRSPRIELASTNVSTVINEVQHAPALNTAVLQLNAADYAMAMVQNGVLHAESTADIAACRLLGGRSIFRNASYVMATVDCWEGSHEIARDVTTCNLYGGSLKASNTAVVPATVNIHGGMLEVLGIGTTAQLNGYRGGMDISQMRRPIEVTAATLYPSFRFRMRRGQPLPTFGSVSKPYGEPTYEYVD